VPPVSGFESCQQCSKTQTSERTITSPSMAIAPAWPCVGSSGISARRASQMIMRMGSVVVVRIS